MKSLKEPNQRLSSGQNIGLFNIFHSTTKSSTVKTAVKSSIYFPNNKGPFLTSYLDSIHLDLSENTTYHGSIMNSVRNKCNS